MVTKKSLQSHIYRKGETKIKVLVTGCQRSNQIFKEQKYFKCQFILLVFIKNLK